MNIDHLSHRTSLMNQQTIDLLIPDMLFHPYCISKIHDSTFYYVPEGPIVQELVKLFDE